MTTSGNLLQNYFSKLYIPRITWTDVIEIIIIAVVLYNILLWIMNTKAWALLKGIIVVALFAVVAYLLNLKTILWIDNQCRYYSTGYYIPARIKACT